MSKGFLNRLLKIPGNSGKDLYFITDGTLVKIGVASKPYKRLSQLQTGNSKMLWMLASFPDSGHRENWCHKRLAHLKVMNEWFRHTDEVDMLIADLKKLQDNKPTTTLKGE